MNPNPMERQGKTQTGWRRWALAIFSVALLLPAVALAQPEVSAELVIDGLASPLQLEAAPDDTDRRFIVDQNGQILILRPDGTLADEPFLDISDRMVELRDGFEERGLIGFAFHPDFADNGRFYVHYSAPLRADAPDNWDHTAIVSEFTVPVDTPDRADHASERELLQVPQVNRKTNAGALAFGPDGYLYIAMGEGGGAHGIGEVIYGALEVPPRGNVWDFQAQDIHNLYGKILRIDVDHGWPGYAVPENNPFVGEPGRDEIFAWGFRNHYRMSFDPAGEFGLLAAAVSESLWETVYRVDEPGNYGWPIREGTYCYDRQNPLDPPEECATEGPNGWTIQDPIIQYPNNNAADSPLDVEPMGTAIVGGHVYRGDALPELAGTFVFADYSLNPREPSGQIYSARPGSDVGELWPIEAVVQLEARAQGMGVDGEGELYVLTRESFSPRGDTGKVFKLVPAETGGANGSADGTDGAEGSSDASDSGDQAAGNSDSGFFTVAQAERGNELYSQHCQSCHGSDLRGGQGPFPALTGNGFFSNWGGRPLSELATYISEKMPLGAAGTLEAQTYADIMAFWLSEHGYEAGEMELPTDIGEFPDVPVEDRSND